MISGKILDVKPVGAEVASFLNFWTDYSFSILKRPPRRNLKTLQVPPGAGGFSALKKAGYSVKAEAI